MSAGFANGTGYIMPSMHVGMWTPNFSGIVFLRFARSGPPRPHRAAGRRSAYRARPQRTRLIRRRADAPDVIRRRQHGAVHTVGDLTGEAQRLRPLHAEQNRHVPRARDVVETNVVEIEAFAVKSEPLAGK